jgi:hypothetical protein
MAIWSILWQFGKFMVIWQIFSRFGKLYQGKSGSPGSHQNLLQFAVTHLQPDVFPSRNARYLILSPEAK